MDKPVMMMMVRVMMYHDDDEMSSIYSYQTVCIYFNLVIDAYGCTTYSCIYFATDMENLIWTSYVDLGGKDVNARVAAPNWELITIIIMSMYRVVIKLA